MSSYEPVESPDSTTVFPYHDLTPPTTADVYRARQVVSEHLPRTPLVRSEPLSERFDADVYLKREDTLPTGAFKVRGGMTLLSRLDEEFREPGLDPNQRVDVVTSNFALHHLADGEKREAIGVMADTGARRIVLGDVAFFEEPDPDAPFYSPEVDDPATVGTLVEAFTDEGFAVTAVERVHDQVAVIVAERIRELPA